MESLAAQAQRSVAPVSQDMWKISISVVLTIGIVLCLQAQTTSRWSTVRQRGLKGKVRVLQQSCSDIKGTYDTKYKYEFAHNGALVKMTSPAPPHYDCILMFPTSLTVTQRNARGDISEVSRSLDGDVIEKERYEYDYDEIGNWIKQTTLLMRTYEMEGGDWKEGEWQPKYVCKRTFEYYR
jgi:hypothetical protein